MILQRRTLGAALSALLLSLLVAGPLPALEVRAGLSVTESVLYADELSWGASGASFDTTVAVGPWFSGFEAASGGLGGQILVPLGWTTATELGAGWKLSPYGQVLAGAALRRPDPVLLVGVQAGARFDWSWAKGWALGITTGLRYTLAPGYFADVPYRVLEVPVSLQLVLGTR